MENLDNNFDKCPIKIEAKVGDSDWQDVTNSTLDLPPEPDRHNDMIYGKYVLRVTNQTANKLYVGALGMYSDMSIMTDPFHQTSQELQPKGEDGDNVTFYYHKSGITAAFLDPYKEVYNWKTERHYYKFIFNNYEDFTGSMASQTDFLSPALPPPMTIEPETRTLKGKKKGGGALDDLKPVRKKWGTALMTVELPNPNHNKVAGDLKKLWDEYSNHELLGPMISELYPNQNT